MREVKRLKFDEGQSYRQLRERFGLQSDTQKAGVQ